jgi:hypothetical protein
MKQLQTGRALSVGELLWRSYENHFHDGIQAAKRSTSGEISKIFGEGKRSWSK